MNADSSGASDGSEALPPVATEALSVIAGLWWIPLVRGVLLIALGGYAFLTPGVTLVTYATVLGVFALLDGVLAIVAGVMGWIESRWGALLRGAIGVLAGLFVLAHPALVGVVAVTTIVILLGVQSLVVGVVEIVTAIRERKEIEGEWWHVLSGLLSVLFGFILLSSPIVAGALLIQMLGVFAIIAGVALILAAFKLRSLHANASPAD